MADEWKRKKNPRSTLVPTIAIVGKRVRLAVAAGISVPLGTSVPLFRRKSNPTPMATAIKLPRDFAKIIARIALGMKRWGIEEMRKWGNSLSSRAEP